MTARHGAHQVQAPAVDYTTPDPEVEYVRTFAQVTQVQLRSVLDALTEQIDRLGEVTRLDGAATDSEPQAFPVPHSRAQHEDLGIDSRAGSSEGAASIYEQVWSVQGRTRE